MRNHFATIEKLDNGYLVRYPEAKKTVRQLPSPLDQIDPDQIELLFNIVNMTTDDGDESWKGDQLDERRKKVRERVEQMKADAAERTIEVWVVVEREFFCASIDAITQGLVGAEASRMELETLQSSGVRIEYTRNPGAVFMPLGGLH